uniref:SWIM-type domain-containing protein n=1 Tax=Neogobius melanostomus TaxID=47308 RepID=A0A8C6SKJ6_9GOBI
MSLWPPTMLTDISAFLRLKDEVELEKRLMGDYKEGKAYSYFASNFTRDINYHGISDDSPFCFLKSASGRSQRRNDEDHRIWVCLQKQSGRILSAYCSCFAGLSSTCNHVAAVLFKLDFAWQQGITNKAVTSLPAVWTKPKGKPKGPDVMEIGDMEWVKPKYGKKKTVMFNSFECYRTNCPLESPTLCDLMAALYASNKDSCVMQYAAPMSVATYSPVDDVNVEVIEEVETTASVPELISVLICQDLPLEMGQSEVAAIAQATHGQHTNPLWHKQRIGRVTGSTAHSVLVYFRKKKSSMQFSTQFVESVMGRKHVPEIPAIKYGHIKEPVARQNYIRHMHSLGHKTLDVKTTGLHVMKSHIFIAASPDGLVTCQCCSPGILEIKCPMSLAYSTPYETPPIYLNKDENGQFSLKKSHNYYTQVQVQLMATECNWCDFFIYTPNGFHCERIFPDVALQKEILKAAQVAFQCVIRPELLYPLSNAPTPDQPVPSTSAAAPPAPDQPVPSTSAAAPPAPDQPVPSTSAAAPPAPDQPVPSTSAAAPPAPDQPVASSSAAQENCEIAKKRSNSRMTKDIKTIKLVNKRSGKRNTKTGKPVYLCGVCKKICKESEEMTENDDNSVECDRCSTWHHWGCVGFDVGIIDNYWVCLWCSDM